MTSSIKLTDTQIEVLTLGADRPNGCIEPMPARLNSLLRTKVIAGLANRGMIIDAGGSEFHLTDAGYEAVGRVRPVPASIHADPHVETAVTAAEASSGQEKQEAAQRLIKVGVEGKPRIRENTKQATVIQMLSRPNGATINELCEATGWLQHTMRGTLAGALKKKLGLNITSYKDTGASRVYRLNQEAATC